MMTRFGHCVLALLAALTFSVSALLAETIRYSITNVGTLGADSFSAASGINDIGQVVGISAPQILYGRAFLWQSGSGMQGLPLSSASGINNSGEVVGNTSTPFGETTHAFLWDSGSGRHDLGTLGGSSSWASGINDHGQVVGYASTSSGENHAFFGTA